MSKVSNILFLLCILCGLVSGNTAVLAGESGKDEIAARVNGVIISRQAVERAEALVQGAQREESDRSAPEEQQQRFRLALENLITEELLYQEAVAQGIKIEKKEVHQVIRQMKESMPGAEFSKLAFTHWSVKDEIMKTIERDLMIQRLFKAAVIDQAEVSEEELLHFYKTKQELFRTDSEVKLQQIIFFAESDWQVELVRDKANEIVDRARRGEDFVELAHTYSHGPVRDQEGDKGWRSVKYLPQNLKVAVQEAEVDDILAPVQMPGGLAIAKVLGKRPPRVVPFSEVRNHLARTLKENKLRERRDEFLQELRSRANIEVLFP